MQQINIQDNITNKIPQAKSRLFGAAFYGEPADLENFAKELDNIIRIVVPSDVKIQDIKNQTSNNAIALQEDQEKVTAKNIVEINYSLVNQGINFVLDKTKDDIELIPQDLTNTLNPDLKGVTYKVPHKFVNNNVKDVPRNLYDESFTKGLSTKTNTQDIQDIDEEFITPTENELEQQNNPKESNSIQNNDDKEFEANDKFSQRLQFTTKSADSANIIRHSFGQGNDDKIIKTNEKLAYEQSFVNEVEDSANIIKQTLKESELLNVGEEDHILTAKNKIIEINEKQAQVLTLTKEIKEPLGIIKQSTEEDASLSLLEDSSLLEESNSIQEEESVLEQNNYTQEDGRKIAEANDNSQFQEESNEDQSESSDGLASMNEKLSATYKDSSFVDILAHNNKQKDYIAKEVSATNLVNERVGHNNAELINFKISKVLAKDEHHIEVSLTPENLGKINIRIEEQANGISKLIVSAERQETLNLLSESIKELHRELTEIGLNTDGSTTEFNLNDQNQSRQQETSNNLFSFLSYKEDDEDKIKIEQAYKSNGYKGIIANNRVDFRV